MQKLERIILRADKIKYLGGDVMYHLSGLLHILPQDAVITASQVYPLMAIVEYVEEEEEGEEQRIALILAPMEPENFMAHLNVKSRVKEKLKLLLEE